MPVCTDAILAIKPIFVKLIVERKKNHEFRKYLLEDAERLWLYQTAPVSKIT
jgi:predicted transcriptional regulator